MEDEITNALIWLDAIETKHGLIQIYECPDRDVFVLYDTDERYMGEVTYEYICGLYDIATIEETWNVWLKDVKEGETSVRFLFETLFGFKYVRLVPLKDCNVIGEHCFIRE